MSERLETLIARRDWVQRALVDLDRNLARAPWMLAGNLLAIPAWRIWNVNVAMLVVVMVVGLAFTTFYVAWVHRGECEGELEGLQREIARLGLTEGVAEGAPGGALTGQPARG